MNENTAGNLKSQEALNKYALIGKMSADILHDINNPLGIITANIEMMELLFENDFNIGDTTEVLDIIDIVKRSLNRINLMLTDLSEYCHTSSGSTQNTDINLLIEKTLKIIHAKAMHNIMINKTLSKLPEIKCDRSRIMQILLNIVMEITGSLKSDSGKKRIDISTGYNDKSVTISIDTDIRISCDAETENLTISKNIVHNIGGTLTFNFKDTAGTEVVLTIPA